jgi:small subunit ribosomal protein S19e
LLRKIYIHGPLGLRELKSAYGGRKSVGFALAHHRDGGGSSVRKALQQLETAGLVTKHGSDGRTLTSKGTSLVDRLSHEILKELVKEKPGLAKYA